MAAPRDTPKTPDAVGEVSRVMDNGTPVKAASTSRLRGRTKGKVLFPAQPAEARVKWSDQECNALVAFLMLHTDGKSWVSHNETKFWDQAGVFIQQQLKTGHCRTG